MDDRDVLIAVDKLSPESAMILAASRGLSVDDYKAALKKTYVFLWEKVYVRVVDNMYQYAVSEVERLIELDSEKTNVQLEFWATIAEDYEDKHFPIR